MLVSRKTMMPLAVGLAAMVGCAVLLTFTASVANASLTWYLRDSNSTGAATIPPFDFGNNADKPIPADWDNNGTDTVGVFQPDGWWRLRNSNTPGSFDLSWLFGQQAGDKPVPADWGPYKWEVPGIVRGNEWLYPNPFQPGPGSISLGGFGNPGDIPFADGQDAAGLYTHEPKRIVVRSLGGAWHWFRDYPYASMAYGSSATHVPVLGDWDGDGDKTPGTYVPSTGYWYLNNDWTDNIADGAFIYGGMSNAKPVAGDWNGDGYDTIGVVVPG
jgi:hypothetical protein